MIRRAARRKVNSGLAASPIARSRRASAVATPRCSTSSSENPTPEESRPWTERLTAGLARSREKLAGALGGVFARRKLDDETLEELETALITADVGVAATAHLLDDLSRALEARGRRRRPEGAAQGGAASSCSRRSSSRSSIGRRGRS